MNDSLSNLKDEQLDYLFKDDNADLRIIRACGEKGAAFGITCLTRAAENGRLDLVKYLVEEKKVLEFTRYEEDRHRDYSDNGTEPLIEAAQHGYQEIVQYLLEKYPSLKDIQDDDNALPLHHAARYAYFERRRWRRGSTPFDASPKTYEECLRLLSSNWDTAYVNAESDKGTPLCLAADRGTLPAIRLLLDHGADVNGGKYTSDGTPVLQGNDEEETIMALMDRKDVDWTATNEKGETLFHNFRPETPRLVDFYVEKLEALSKEQAVLRSCEGTTLLHALVNAIGNEDFDGESRKKLRDCIPTLLKNGIDVNALSWADGWRNNCNGTAAHCAARNNDLETLKILAENKADLTAVDCQGNTLFMAAADSSRYRASITDMKAVFDFLSKEKVDIAQTNDQGQNVLFNLCETEKREAFDYVLELAKKTKAVKMLKQVDKDGKNLLWYAVEARNLPLVEFLDEKELTVNEQKVQEFFIFICAVLRGGIRENNTDKWHQFIKENYKKLGCSLDLLNKLCSIVLKWTISRFNNDPSDFKLIEMLIDERPSDCTQKNEDGEGIFHWLASASAFDSDLADYLYSKVPEMLDAPNKEGILPIHIAAQKSNLDFCKWVLSKKQEYDILSQKYKNGNTILNAYLHRAGRNEVSTLCSGLSWIYEEAHKHSKRFFDKENSCSNGQNPLEMYFKNVKDDAEPEVVSLLCQWCHEENHSLDMAIQNWAVAGEASPACLQAYLDACSQYGLPKPLDWEKLFDSALEKGNTALALFIMEREFNPLEGEGATLSELWKKAVKGDDGNYLFFRTLFDKYKWPKSILNVRKESALFWLLKDDYSDEKLPLFKFLWKYTDDAGDDFTLTLPNNGAAQTIAWLLNHKQITMQDLSSPLAKSLLKEIRNPREHDESWIESFDPSKFEMLVKGAMENHGMLRYILDTKKGSISSAMLESAVENDDVIALALLLSKTSEIANDLKQKLLQKAFEKKSGDLVRFLIEVIGIKPSSNTKIEEEESTEFDLAKYLKRKLADNKK